jgi:hypothetical protein
VYLRLSIINKGQCDVAADPHFGLQEYTENNCSRETESSNVSLTVVTSRVCILPPIRRAPVPAFLVHQN